MSALANKAPVTVLIPTLNEELNLSACLTSVAWADQVIVVDSFSTDETVRIAGDAGAEAVQHAFENYSRQKNWALDTLAIRHPWVLIVDADERVTPPLQAEIERIVRAEPAPHSAPVGYYLNRRFIFLGHWVRHCGWYPSWNLRLFRHGLGRYDDREVHEHMVVDGPVAYLQHDLLHEDQRGLEAFVARHNRYSTLEANARLKAERNSADRAWLATRLLGSPVERKRFVRERIWPRLPLKPLALFVYMFLVRRGFQDGRAGLALCLFHAYQEWMVGLKLAELRRGVRV
jgi:glycosyltransferase involved in cell wall biosynthesis